MEEWSIDRIQSSYRLQYVMSETVVTRFAPSPTGWLHLGHAFAALTAHGEAKADGGCFLVRLEDIDGTRIKPEYEAAIFEDLAWLGLTWEEPVRKQSEHLEDYLAALKRLDSLGLMYPCFCTRREILAEIAGAVQAPQGPDGPLYPGSCRGLPVDEQARRLESGLPYALRLDVAKASAMTGRLMFCEGSDGLTVATPEIFGDVVLARKETPTSYHLSVVVDDALQGVTLVTRGEDLKPATHLHRLLQALLNLPVPNWKHHQLITDETGKRLAKRNDARSLRSLRAAGWSPDRVRETLAKRLPRRGKIR